MQSGLLSMMLRLNASRWREAASSFFRAVTSRVKHRVCINTSFSNNALELISTCRIVPSLRFIRAS